MLNLGALEMPKERPVGNVRVDLDPSDETRVRDTYVSGAHPGGRVRGSYVLGAHRAVTGAVVVAVQATPREGRQVIGGEGIEADKQRGPGQVS